jgi:cytochrome c peroxidase
LIAGFEISEPEIDDVVAFLLSLTDERFLQDPAHGDPWPAHGLDTPPSRRNPNEETR